jgi:hypothetical protein
MNNHVIIPLKDVTSIHLISEYEDWLKEWLQALDQDINNDEVSSSLCLQAIYAELALYKKLKRDWTGVFQELLTDSNGNPLAYSEKYGKRLYNFEAQWKQTPIHAIYTQWWYYNNFDKSLVLEYALLIEKHIQSSGWIYNSEESPTRINKRMKSELLMSMAMGIEILTAAKSIDQYKERFESAISSLPLTGFLGAEYFRILALEQLKSLNLLPLGLQGMVQSCQAGKGFCDFSINDKIDDYMGTAKRTDRDKAIHSPLFTLYADYISNYLDGDSSKWVKRIAVSFGEHLRKNPFDIPSFTMRDIEVPFGTGITPIELLCAAQLMDRSLTQNN